MTSLSEGNSLKAELLGMFGITNPIKCLIDIVFIFILIFFALIVMLYKFGNFLSGNDTYEHLKCIVNSCRRYEHVSIF